MEVATRRRGRPPRNEVDGRDALLRAATRAFARVGFERADLRGIAADAGVSPNLVRVHFGSKAALWTGCLDRLTAAVAPSLAAVQGLANEHAHRPLSARLRDAIMAAIAIYDEHPDVRDFVTMLAHESPERAALVTDRLLRPAYDAGVGLITAGIEAGVIRSSHPALFFVLLHSAISQPPAFGALLNRLAPDIDPADARRHLTDSVVASFLHRGDDPQATDPISSNLKPIGEEP